MSAAGGYSDPQRSQARSALVIGGGIAGMSLAAELARHDPDVLLVEGESEPTRHTTGRSAASYIPGHGPAPTRALIAASWDRFAALADEAGHGFLRARPVLFTAHDDVGERRLRDELAPLDVVTALDPGAACRRWPALRRETLRAAVVVEGAQDVDAIGLHDHYRRLLRARGGTLRTRAAVTALDADGDGWRVGLDGDTVTTDRVVIAAGAWTDRLLALAGVPTLGLRPLRRTIAIARVPTGSAVDRDDPFVIDADDRWYAKPEGEHLLVSPAEETPADPGDPRPDELDVAAALERVNAVTTLGLRSVVTSWTGLRTFAPDRLLVVGDRPEHRGLHVFAGQGGSGIESAPAAAALAAAVVRGAVPPADLLAHGLDPAALAATRFGAARSAATRINGGDRSDRIG